MGNILSIIITNKDDSNRLPRQLKSIVSQRTKPDEIIITDDGSKDNSKQIIQRFYEENKDSLNIKIILNNTSQGYIARANHAIDISACQYLYFGASDDYLLPDFVKLHREAIIDYSPPITCSDNSLPHIGMSHKLEDLGNYYLPGHCSCIKKTYLIEFDKHISEFQCYCDWFFLHSIGLKYGWYTIPQTLSVKDNTPGYAQKLVDAGYGPALKQKMKNRVLTYPLFQDIKNDMLLLIDR